MAPSPILRSERGASGKVIYTEQFGRSLERRLHGSWLVFALNLQNGAHKKIGFPGSSPAFRVQATVSAKTADERCETAATKAQEAETGKESAAPIPARSSRLVDVKAQHRTSV